MKHLKIIAAIILFIALIPLPIGYYQFLRIAVSIISAISAYKSYSKNNLIMVFAFCAILIVFNPIIPIYLSKEIWHPIDIVCGIVFAFSWIKDIYDERRNDKTDNT